MTNIKMCLLCNNPIISDRRYKYCKKCRENREEEIYFEEYLYKINKD